MSAKLNIIFKIGGRYQVQHAAMLELVYFAAMVFVQLGNPTLWLTLLFIVYLGTSYRWRVGLPLAAVTLAIAVAIRYLIISDIRSSAGTRAPDFAQFFALHLAASIPWALAAFGLGKLFDRYAPGPS